jgi:hypothetical protein
MLLNNLRVTALIMLVAVLTSESGLAFGLRGGGGGGGRSMGGGSGAGRVGGGGGGGMSRPAPRPSVPNMGSSRPAPTTRPNVGSPNFNRPTTKPAMPSHDRPSGGLKPSTRPVDTGRPEASNRPSTRPAKPELPNTRPAIPGGINPGGANKLPGQVERPVTRPGIPNLGGGAATLPSNKLPNFSGTNRPAQTLPGNAGNRPDFNMPPTISARPTPGDVGDFLGMGKPLRPETLPGNVGPGLGNRPGIENRPGISSRPGVSTRPSFPSVGVANNRPINIGQINVGNNVAISNRPTWANIDRNQITNINNRWQNQIGGLNNWQNVHPNRAAYWAGWGAGVHSAYHWHYHNPGCFRGDWWYSHPHSWCGWHYGYGFTYRPWNYWWTVPTYAACVNWFTWSAPQQVWAQPVYYDYGQGGNVVYNDNSVYINGEKVASTTEFAQSAADLATVAPPADEETAKKSEWLALGTFTVSSGEKDVEPNRIIQLAVNKDGVVSGTLYNTETDLTQSVQGKVDKDTQRVAIRITESENLVAETGLYNLTQEQAPVLVHFGAEKVENWLFVRLEDPAPETSTETSASAPQP